MKAAHQFNLRTTISTWAATVNWVYLTYRHQRQIRNQLYRYRKKLKSEPKRQRSPVKAHPPKQFPRDRAPHQQWTTHTWTKALCKAAWSAPTLSLERPGRNNNRRTICKATISSPPSSVRTTTRRTLTTPMRKVESPTISPTPTLPNKTSLLPSRLSSSFKVATVVLRDRDSSSDRRRTCSER